MAQRAEVFTPDQAQQQVFERVASGDHGPLLVLGGPGTGKTTTAAHLALRFLQSGHDSHELLLLSPTRSTSARLRDAVESRWAQDPRDGTLTDQPSRSFASYAFRIIGEARRRGLLDLADRAPRLLSGAEQDREIAALLSSEETRIDWRVVDPSTGEGTREIVRADLREAAGTSGFRQEIRELFDRASEYGVGPEELTEWGREAAAGRGPGHPAWQPAGELYGLYLDVLGQQAPNAFDPSGLIARACDVLEEDAALLEAERGRLRLILVDDLQEANPNVHRLLRLIGAGGPVVAFANPDAAVQGFRGARPDLLANWAADGGDQSLPDGTRLRGRRGSMRPTDVSAGRDPEVLSLVQDHRMSDEVGAVYGRVVRRIGAVGDSQLYRSRWELLAVDRSQELEELVAAQRTRREEDHAHGSRAKPGPHRNFPAGTDTSARGSSVSIVGSEDHGEQMILQEVLERHHRGGPDGAGVPLGEIAVITRSGTDVHRLMRLFAAHGLAVERSMSEVVLRRETAVAPLLRIMRAVTGTEAEDRLDVPTVQRLLAGPYGGVDAITLRRIRRVLLALERERIAEAGEDVGGARGSDALLLAAVEDPEDPVSVRAAESEHRALTGLRRIARMVAAARGSAETPGAGPGDVLWALWTAGGRQRRWVEESEGGGEQARRANRDLDAVVALFEAAERYTDQLPGQRIGHFVTYIEEMELPMDTLAETSTVGDAVSVLTPATAAGREFDTVILTGMQDGVWPDLRPRGELLASSRLADLAAGDADRGGRSARAKRMQVLQDEYRLFAAAVSRARRRLVGIGVTSTDQTPSLLIDLIVPPVERPSPELARPRPMTAPTLAAELRRTLESHASGDSRIPDDVAEDAARALAVLGNAYAETTGESITGAAPSDWWGLVDPKQFEELITEDELDEGAQIRVSPSSAGTAQDQPLSWFVGAVGGEPETDRRRELGMLIHSIAEDHPEPDEGATEGQTGDRLTAVLADRWPELGMAPDSFESRQEFVRAEAMVRRLAWYLHAAHDQGRTHVASEAHFTVSARLPVRGTPREVTVSGKIDRLEREDDGRYYIIDHKTGKEGPRRCPAHPQGSTSTSPEECGICGHAQLGLYQRLVATPGEQKVVVRGEDEVELSGETAGAGLLYLGSVAKNLEGIEYRQQAVGDVEPGEDWPAEAQAWPDLLLIEAAATVTGRRFMVHHVPGQSCRAGVLCPICPGAGTVTQPNAE
ncbi:UrvD/REP family ATP-dependent DNA helicase [Nesterenkonia marinintestina]|uniref:UrvD/REP family ATP-dependent DNA helicase n=1 Tax=Nesterenkonia marinintestina TaxID=2979865 RepID=UPI0021C01702|nr:UrvD/REP family ATP-dependent DNA helicase [Nesterenkonia sp. GX14115]